IGRPVAGPRGRLRPTGAQLGGGSSASSATGAGTSSRDVPALTPAVTMATAPTMTAAPASVRAEMLSPASSHPRTTATAGLTEADADTRDGGATPTKYRNALNATIEPNTTR